MDDNRVMKKDAISETIRGVSGDNMGKAFSVIRSMHWCIDLSETTSTIDIKKIYSFFLVNTIICYLIC